MFINYATFFYIARFADILENAHRGDAALPLSRPSRMEKSLASSLLDLRLSAFDNKVFGSAEKQSVLGKRGPDGAPHCPATPQQLLCRLPFELDRGSPYTVTPTSATASYFGRPAPSRQHSISLSPDLVSFAQGVGMMPGGIGLVPSPQDVPVSGVQGINLRQNPSIEDSPAMQPNIMQLGEYPGVSLPGGLDYSSAQFPQVDWSDLERMLGQ